MGRNARETEKTKNTLHLQLTKGLDDRVNFAWHNGPDADIDRKQFVLKLIRTGVDEYLTTHSKYFDARSDLIAAKQIPDFEPSTGRESEAKASSG